MKVSVVVPTLNAEMSIAKLVSRLKEQTLPPTEIIVVDSSSMDRTLAIAKEMDCKTILIDKDSFDHGGTRNLGSEVASGEVIAFLTHDALPTNNKYLEKLIKPMENQRIAATFGRQVALPDAIPPERFSRLFNYPKNSIVKSKEDIPRLGIKTFFFSDVCSAIRRREFNAIGGFPERIILNEDMILASKLILQGYKIAYVPEAEVWHSHNYNIFQQFKRHFDIGASLSMNSWILEFTKAEGEGLRFVKEQLAYLLHHGHYSWIPYTLGLTMAKYAGYKLGLMEGRLPLKLKNIFSMHSSFWLR